MTLTQSTDTRIAYGNGDTGTLKSLVIKLNFRDEAQLAVERLEHEIAIGNGKRSYTDYIQVINDYLIPIMGWHSINSIDY